MLVTIGSAAGLLSGMLGVAGGVIIVPLLTSRRIGLSPAAASGTSLAAIVPIAAVGMTAYSGYHDVDLGAALSIITGAIVGSATGARLAPRVSGNSLRLAFCLLLMLTSIRLLAPLWSSHGVAITGAPVGAVDGATRIAGLVAVGLGSGLVSGLLGSGGGTIMVPALVIAFGFPQQLAQGTALLAVLPTCASGIVQHRRQGTIDFPAAWRVGLGGALTVGFGAVLAAHAPAAALQFGLAGYILVTAIVGLIGLRRGMSRRSSAIPKAAVSS